MTNSVKSSLLNKIPDWVFTGDIPDSVYGPLAKYAAISMTGMILDRHTDPAFKEANPLFKTYLRPLGFFLAPTGVFRDLSELVEEGTEKAVSNIAEATGAESLKDYVNTAGNVAGFAVKALAAVVIFQAIRPLAEFVARVL